MKILDGKKLSEEILENLSKEKKRKRLKLKLAVILVGENHASKVFVKEKEKACQKVGIDFQLFKFSSKINSKRFKKEIKKISKTANIKGVIIQLPLPKNFNSQDFLNLIPPEKDIDVLTETNIGKFYNGSLSISPPAVGGIKNLLEKYKISLKGKNIVLVGAGKLVGMPISLWLMKEKISFSIIDKFTKNISFFTKKADIIISGVGKPEFITGSMVKKGVVVVDAGVSRKGKKIVGDINFKNVSQKASYITPIPGGVGPMTVACLLKNLVELATDKN